MRAVRLFVAASLFLLTTATWAAPPSPPPGNLAQAVATLQVQVAALQAQVNTLTKALNTVNSNTVLQLNGKLSLDNADPAHPIARFNAINVEITNGLGATQTINGLGNLIVGYNETGLLPGNTREDPLVVHTGSHNLVVGEAHRYTSYGGLVAGAANEISGTFASVSGGNGNKARGRHSSVSGGGGNIASGSSASVSGGESNTASGLGSSVSGGERNTASGGPTGNQFGASVSGGYGILLEEGYAWAAGNLKSP